MVTDDEVKDEVEGEDGIPDELSDLPEEAEADFSIGSPVSTLDDDDIENEDPHASFDVPVHEEDPHLDPYGVGAPSGYVEDDEEEEDLLPEEEIDSY
jgi:hypothetical protein